MTKAVNLTEEECQYALIMLSEGQTVIDESEAFNTSNFRSTLIQESVIEKVRKKCWEFHNEKQK